MASVCQALKDFSDKLYAKVVESQGGNYHNVFVSPVSIYAAMSMVLAGSQGETKREMLSALQLAAGMSQETHHNSIGTTIRSCFESTPGVTVSVGNRLFAEQNAPINAEYKSLLLKDYQADTENVDFLADAESARKRINKWVSEQTKEKIQELFPPGSLRSDSCVAITNALYFKGSWEIAFPKEVTGQHDFYLLNGTKKKMKMMYKEDDFKSTVLADLDSVAVKLPFRQSKWEMLIILPNKRDGINNLLPKLESDGLSKVLNEPFDKQKTSVLLPRFKLSENEGVNAKDLLMKLGMNAVFATGSADLSGICSSIPLFISDVKHKAILEVDEEGATAAAATGAIATFCCIMPSMQVRVVHPFFVALVYDDKIPIFMGHVLDPEEN